MVTRLQRTILTINLPVYLRIWFVRGWFLISNLFNYERLSVHMFMAWQHDLTRLIKWGDMVVRENTQRGAFALIAVGPYENRHYLLQWNANWKMFNLIGGKLDNNKGDADSFWRAIQRELEEELGLVCPGEFFIIREIGRLKMKQFSRREQKTKNYIFSVFEVNISPIFTGSNGRPNFAARWLSTGRENVFVSAAEINDLCTKDGRPISLTTRRILQEIEELPHY